MPDGRQPVRFDTGRAAFYMKARGEGETRYTFSMIRWIQKNRANLLTEEERRQRAKLQAEQLIQKDPDYFRKIGRKGGIGKGKSYGGKNSRKQEGQGR